MHITLSQEANKYINATILRIAETNSVNRELRRKLERLAGKFNPQSDIVKLKMNEAESIKALMLEMQKVCTALQEDKSVEDERKELAKKRNIIYNAVVEKIDEATKSNTRKS